MQMTVGDAIHLNQLHNILNSGMLHPADEDMIVGKIFETELGFGMLDRFERPMSWEYPLERTIAGRKIREDEMADYKNQQVEEMIERSGESLDDYYSNEKGDLNHGSSEN